MSISTRSARTIRRGIMSARAEDKAIRAGLFEASSVVSTTNNLGLFERTYERSRKEPNAGMLPFVDTPELQEIRARYAEELLARIERREQ